MSEPKAPTSKQLATLRSLAARTGGTFTYPRTRAAASAEIHRLLQRPRSGQGDVARERGEVQRHMAERPDDGSRFRDSETTGYGSGARWAHGSGIAGEQE